MTDSLLRIVLACYLALWSPVLCCCSVKAAINSVVDTDVPVCGEVAPRASCCSAQANEVRSAKGTDEVCGNRPESHQPQPCRCHEIPESKVRLDTGAKVTTPSLTHTATLPIVGGVLIFDQAHLTRLWETNAAYRCGVPGGGAWDVCIAPSPTLLRWRTLLLI